MMLAVFVSTVVYCWCDSSRLPESWRSRLWYLHLTTAPSANLTRQVAWPR